MTKKKWALLVIVIGLVVAGGWWATHRKPKETQAPRPIIVTRGTITITVSSTGVVAPENRVEIKPPISGRVERVLVQEGDKIRKGQIIAWISSTERSALLDLARAKGPAEVAHWEELYKPTPLTAPITGSVISRLIEPGQSVSPQDAILVLADRLMVKAQVDETDIGKVHVGQTATFGLDAYPDKRLKARVGHIAYEAQTVSNVTIYDVHVIPEKPPVFLKSGMTSDVLFVLNQVRDVVCIPLEALVLQKNQTWVISGYTPKGKPLKKIVETGLNDGRFVQILSGVVEGETLYIPNADRLKKKKSSSSPFMQTGQAPKKRGGS